MAAGLQLSAGGKVFEARFETVPLTQIQLDPGNPRIRFLIQRRHKKKKLSEKELMDLIREQPGYDGLQKAIRKAGGLHDPIIIRDDGSLVEGNSRTTAYKTLHNGNKEDPRWHHIPVVRLSKEVSDQATGLLMAAYHVAGKTVWRPYAQADQIYQLHEVLGCTLEQIADETRMSVKEVQQYLAAYEYLVKEVLPHAADGDEDDVLQRKFSHALEFVKRKNLAAIRKDPEMRKQVAKLLVEGKIQGAEMRKLDKILGNKKAAKVLKDKGFKAAKEVLKETDPTIGSKVLKTMESLTQQLKDMDQTELTLLKGDAKAQQILLDLHEALRDVAAVTGVKLGSRHA